MFKKKLKLISHVSINAVTIVMSLITEPSICIPRTLHNVGWRDVKNVFETLFGKGTVERVDIVVDKRDASPFCRIFVHMRYWPVDKSDVADIRQRLIDGETIKIVYDNPWFWKCSASRTPKPDRTRSAPFIQLDTSPVNPGATEDNGKGGEKKDMDEDKTEKDAFQSEGHTVEE